MGSISQMERPQCLMCLTRTVGPASPGLVAYKTSRQDSAPTLSYRPKRHLETNADVGIGSAVCSRLYYTKDAVP